MRDSLDIEDRQALEAAPLIPDPPLNRKRKFLQHSFLRRCWRCCGNCSRWTCMVVTVSIIILIIVLCRELLPFGWPSWWPQLTYDSNDPHIVLIMADDLGWNDVGYGQYALNSISNTNSKKLKYNFIDLKQVIENNGIEQEETQEETQDTQDTTDDSDLFSNGVLFETPKIDELAHEGIILNRFYVSQEGASTRASILTGKHGYRMGLQTGISVGSNAHVPTEFKMLSEILSEQRSYATYLIGKWNLGYARWTFTPTFRGFDKFVGYLQSWIDYWHYTSSDESIGNENRVGWDLWNNLNVYELGVSERKYTSEFFTEEAMNTISDHATGDNPDRPMFLMFSPPNPHTPLAYHTNYNTEYCSNLDSSLREKHCNVVQSFDNSVGGIVSALKEHSMWDRTLLIIASDNGGMVCYDVGTTSKCSGSSNSPLRAGKGTLFEGGVRTRALLTGGLIPNKQRGTIANNVMQHVDLFATLLAASNIKNNKISQLSRDGINHYQYLMGEDNEFDERESAILDVLLDDDNNIIRGAIIEYPFKYIIQSSEEYDGWYLSPLDDGSNIPDKSQGFVSKYQSNNAGMITMINDYEEYYIHKKQNSENIKIKNFIVKNEEIDNDNGNIEYNEYLFDLSSDPGETSNLMEINQDIARALNGKLLNVMDSDGYKSPQDSSSHSDSCPNNFGNIWYPFRESFHH